MLELVSRFLLTTFHFTVNTIKRTHVLIQRINKHALLIKTKLIMEDLNFDSMMCHRRSANEKQTA